MELSETLSVFVFAPCALLFLESNDFAPPNLRKNAKRFVAAESCLLQARIICAVCCGSVLAQETGTSVLPNPNLALS
jgi:hypothetical protein